MESTGSTVLWLDKTFDETLKLLEEAKNYHANIYTHQVRNLVPKEHLDVTTESLRVTARLSHTMAWLISEKAILNEEMAREDIEARHPPLEAETTCTNIVPENYELCPEGLQSLLNRSRELFMRAARLEKMLRKNQTTCQRPTYH